MGWSQQAARTPNRAGPPHADQISPAGGPDRSEGAGPVPGSALIAAGHDFSRIPVHAEREADRMADEVVRAAPQAGDVRPVMESRFGHDLSQVRVHTGPAAAGAARAAGARAYTIGRDIVFGAGEFNPGTTAGNRLLAHELAHVVALANGPATTIARKEVPADADVHGTQDWTTADREQNTKRWQDACLANLNNVDSSQYLRVVERRDFYKWFFEYTNGLGYTTRWALAARLVADGAHQIADMDVRHVLANDVIGLAGVELQGAMREGNQVIFDNVLPKLKKLLDGGKLTGEAALRWDMQTLAEEQTLIQPLYDRMSPEAREQLDYIARKKGFAGWGAKLGDEDQVPAGPFNKAGTVPAFDQPDITRVGDRWRYGMDVGNTFMTRGTRFDPARDTMPQPGPGYADRTEFNKVDTRRTLHLLDAWLNPNRWDRTGPHSDIGGIIGALSAAEKNLVLTDISADGWRYSMQFAQFDFITETMVRQALPPDSPETAAAKAEFLTRYRNERARVIRSSPPPSSLP